MGPFNTFLQNFGHRWNALSFNQKILVGTLILGLVFSSVFLFQQAQDDYDVLYSNLSLPDASAIAAKLKEEKTPFRLADGGTTILVPRSQKNGLILDTAAELNSEQTVNLTQIPPVVSGEVQAEWIKKLNTNTIISVLKEIQGIKNAQVIVSQPEKNLFIEDDEPPRASVMLMVEPGFRLREEQVKTIKNLVSHAVPGLTAENVVIADNSGNSLEGPGSGGGIDGQSSADMRRKHFEDEKAKKVARVLGPVVGKENVVVSVSAVLNFDQSQSQIHRLIPSGGDAESPVGVAVSQQNQTEEYTGSKKAGAGGEPGVESNTPSYASEDPKNDGKNGEYRSGKTTTNYEISKEDKTVVYAPGAVERMTVAVVLNKVLTSQETQEIRDLVANAAGVDFARGDSIDIKGFQFSQPIEDKESMMADATKQAQDQAFWLQLATIITVGLMVVVASFIFYSLIKQPAEGKLVEEPAEEPYEYYDDADELIEMKEIPQIEARLDPEMEMKREAINNAIENDPAEAARLLMTYMRDA